MIAAYAPRALRDLDAIAEYLAKRSPSGKTNVMRAIKSSIAAVTAFPEMAPKIDAAGHRRLQVPRLSYSIYYRIAGTKS